jgi:hypothetical protein
MAVDHPEQGWSLLCNGLILIDHEPLAQVEHQPQRIQQRRTAGWRKPAGAVYVGRPSRYGNPFRSDVHTAAGAVSLYRIWLLDRPELVTAARTQLRGLDLACWCPLDQPCHADVLLKIANGHPEGEHVFPLGAPDADGRTEPGDCSCGMTYLQYDLGMGERILAELIELRRSR